MYDDPDDEKKNRHAGLLIGLAIATLLMIACAIWHETINDYLNQPADGACARAGYTQG